MVLVPFLCSLPVSSISIPFLQIIRYINGIHGAAPTNINNRVYYVQWNTFEEFEYNYERNSTKININQNVDIYDAIREFS